MADYIIRRDPRVEWIRRNRLHPAHESVMVKPVEEMGPNGLLRRYPHRVGYLGPNGLKRIDRLNRHSVSDGISRHSNTVDTSLPLHQVDNPDFYVAVVPDMAGGRLTAHDKDVLGQAHQLVKQSGNNGAVIVVVFGTHKEEGFDLAGVDRLMTIEDPCFEQYAPDIRAQVLGNIDKQLLPKHWLFPDSIDGGFELGARFCALVQERPATQAWSVNAQDTVCRAASGRHDIKRATPKVLLLAQECALPIDETRHQALAITPTFELPTQGVIDDLGAVAVDPQAVPLTEAEFILSAGNGVHEWDGFHEAAEKLGATEGASRVAVDDGFMPRHRQVGATGSWVTARVYVAVGISGAIQHLQGIGGCEKVIAVNTDEGCDMVKRADLSVIADSDQFLRALIALLSADKAEDLQDAA